MKYDKHICFLPVMILLTGLVGGCGKGVVSVAGDSYEMKIVIEGYLKAGMPVSGIHVSRNFPLDQSLRDLPLLPDPSRTEVTLIDMESGQSVQLTFHQPDNPEDRWFHNYYWEYTGTGFGIQCGRTYRMEVAAVFDGTSLFAAAETTVPSREFGVRHVNHDTLQYREYNNKGEMACFIVEFDRAPGCDFYLACIRALDNRVENFIYDNPFAEYSEQDVADDLTDLTFESEVLVNMSLEGGVSRMHLLWNNFRFYHDYEIVMMAGDKNYKDFYMTYDNVQEMDGNYHEPRFHLEGDGIGVFGSVVTDTVHVFVKK